MKCSNIIVAALLLAGCTERVYDMGSYAYDLEFLSANAVEYLELCTDDGLSRVLTVPAYQGRVLTSSSNGKEGASYGWINYKVIESSERSGQFNNFGGEERFWLGPEGGLNSWFFAEGDTQDFPHWKVPAAFDTDTFKVVEQDSHYAVFAKDVCLKNAKGISFDVGMKRKVSVLERAEIEKLTGPLGASVEAVAYSSDNSITNKGSDSWTPDTGMPSVWMLGMFNPSETTTVFIPYNTSSEGIIVKDDYFGKIPSDRLKVENGVIWFRIDGKFRSKLGLPAGRSLGLVGAFDPEQQLLTILRTDVPAPDARFVNSQWGEQDDAFGGDALNSYNDGPTEDGTIMGPFFEIESSSPAAALAPGQTLTHSQTTIHLHGPNEELKAVALRLSGVQL